MNQTAAADLQRWSDEVARDPGAPSFVALADAYRRQGRREAALRVCLRGLDRHPSHLGARSLLSKLYLERGDRDRAVAEWRFILRLDPDDFEAHRGLGFLALEKGGLVEAERHLGRAAVLHDGDRTVAGALELVRRRIRSGTALPARALRHDGRARAGPRPANGRIGHRPSPGKAPAPPLRPPQRTPAPRAVATAPPTGSPASQALRDPVRIFESLFAEAPFRGALVLDGQGLVVGGGLTTGSAGRAEALGAALGATLEEAARAASRIGLGAWRGLLLETAEATLHLRGLPGGYVLVLLASRSAPTGWVLRTARQAANIAQRFVEGVA